MISGSRHRVHPSLLLAALASCALTAPMTHGRAIEFAEFVITPQKLFRILWREYLLEFPNLYNKRGYRTFANGTVVFLTDGRPVLSLLTDQSFDVASPTTVSRTTVSRTTVSRTTVSRTTRIMLRSATRGDLLDIVVSDVGADLDASSAEELLLGRVPLALDEPGLMTKDVSIRHPEAGTIKFRTHIEIDSADSSVTTLSVQDENGVFFRITDEVQPNEREITWTLDREMFGRGGRTLRVTVTKSDWMLFGSEQYAIDANPRTPASFQRAFRQRIEGAINRYQELLKKTVEAATCTEKDCADQKGEQERSV